MTIYKRNLQHAKTKSLYLCVIVIATLIRPAVAVDNMKKNDTSWLNVVPGQVSNVKGKDWIYKPRYTTPDQPGVFSESEKKQGGVFYQRQPADVYPSSIPRRSEKIKTLQKFTVPGEFCNMYFVLHSLQPQTIKAVTISDLTTRKGQRIPASQWSVFDVNFRRRLSGRLNHYSIVPEILYDFVPKKLGSAGNIFLWLQAKLSADLQEGFYSGCVTVTTSYNKSLKLPVTLRVLPFTLRKPSANWLMYCGHFWAGGWHNRMRRDIKVRHIQEIMDYGQTGIVHHGGIYSEKSVKESMSIFKDAGMTGPIVIDFGWILENHLAKKLYGKPIKDHKKFPFPECKRPEMAVEFVKFLKNLNTWMKGNYPGKWYYQGIDEVHIYGNMTQAVWEYPLAKKAGVLTSSTVYPVRELKMFGNDILNVSLNHDVKKNKRLYNELKTAAKAQGTEIWMLGPGSYCPANCHINRYQAGLLFYKLKLPACVSWTYGANHDTNELESGRFSYYLAFARKEFKEPREIENPLKKVCNSTLQGEGLREGVQDYKYAFTLHEMIKKARASGHTNAADKAEKQLTYIINELIPYYEGFQKAEKITINESGLEQIRWALANEILALQEVQK